MSITTSLVPFFFNSSPNPTLLNKKIPCRQPNPPPHLRTSPSSWDPKMVQRRTRIPLLTQRQGSARGILVKRNARSLLRTSVVKSIPSPSTRPGSSTTRNLLNIQPSRTTRRSSKSIILRAASSSRNSLEQAEWCSSITVRPSRFYVHI